MAADDIKRELYNEYMLIEGAVLGRELFAFCAVHEEAKQNGVLIGQMFVLEKGVWTRGPYYAMDPTSICDSPFSRTEYAVSGREGDVLRIDGEARWFYKLGHQEVPGPLRRVRRLGNCLFVVGESRGIWRFDGRNWQTLEHGLPDEVPLNLEGNDVDILDRAIDETELAFSIARGIGDELCIVGSGGEIWFWRDDRWEKDDTLTNVNLYDIIYGSDGNYTIVGQLGTMMVGNRGRWEARTTGINSDLLSVSEFCGKTYVATGKDILFWNGENLELVDMGRELTVPAHQVVSRRGVMLSVAAKEVMMTSDGATWWSLLVEEAG